MKNKLAKYRAEREKNDQKISDLQKRNAQLDELILEEENQGKGYGNERHTRRGQGYHRQ